MPLKPKLGFPVTTMWESFTLRVGEVRFQPLNRADSDELGLRLFVPGLHPENVDDAHNAILRALDQGLGERQFAESVQYTEVRPLPNDASADDYIPLVELESYVDWQRDQRSK